MSEEKHEYDYRLEDPSVDRIDEIADTKMLIAKSEMSINAAEAIFEREKVDIFKGIFKLLSGSYLVFKNGRADIAAYHSIPVTKNLKLTFSQAAQELENKIASSVKKRLVSDVPLGVFLSGGIDSSAISYFACQEKNDMQTFSIGFDEPSYDESVYAKKVVESIPSI